MPQFFDWTQVSYLADDLSKTVDLSLPDKRKAAHVLPSPDLIGSIILSL